MSLRFLVYAVWLLGAAALGAEPVQPSLQQAKLNAIPIFNSIHSAARQWGSSLDHNGMAMIPAKIPKGNLLYHGTHTSDASSTGMEWLAFEPEHSEAFSPSWRARQKAQNNRRDQAVLQQITDDQDTPPAIRGYLRTYRTARDLNLLYLDGMSAAKGCMGPMDTSDLVLRLINGTSPCDHFMADILSHDVARASELCEMLTPLGYDGLLRMEAGFEIVYCDFDNGGLALLSQMRRPFWDQISAWYTGPRMAFHLARVAAQHYEGLAGRVQLDFSRMVSAYFYPVNTTNPAGVKRGTRVLPRLLNTTHAERETVQRRVHDVAVAAPYRPSIDWQAITDVIVSRFADRLAFLARPMRAESDGGDVERFVAEVFVATNTHVDATRTSGDVTVGEVDEMARARCRDHYLQQFDVLEATFTAEDRLIRAAVAQVTGRICGALFRARELLQDAYDSVEGPGVGSMVLSKAAEEAQKEVRQLVSDLQWTQWEKCRGGCEIDEVCFVPMYPFGSKEDRLVGPRCLDESGFVSGFELKNNYWEMNAGGALENLTRGPFWAL